jgi:hypothetical protein
MVLLRFSGVNNSTVGVMVLADAISMPHCPISKCPATDNLSARVLRTRQPLTPRHPRPLRALPLDARLVERSLRPVQLGRHQRHALRDGHRPPEAQEHLRQVARPALHRRLCRAQVSSPSPPSIPPLQVPRMRTDKAGYPASSSWS